MASDPGSMSLTRRVLLGTLSMVGARTFALAVSFLCIGLVSRALTPEAFGLWSILTSFAFFGASLDFGLGQGMRNRLAALSSHAQRSEEERVLFFSVLRTMLFLAVGCIGLLALITPWAPWALWLGAEHAQLRHVVPVVAPAVIALFLLSMPLNLNTAGFLAYQEASRRSVFEALQASFLLTAVLGFAGHASFATFIYAYYGLFDAAALFALIFFIRSRGWTWPRLSVRQVLRHVRPIFGSSLSFWLLGVSALIVLSSDPLIAAHVLGLAGAGDFSVVQKLFTVLITMHATVLTPLWSAYTRAATNQDWLWIQTALRKSLLVTVGLIAVGGLGLSLFSGPVLHAWVGRDVNNRSLVLSLVAWAAVYAVTNCYSVVLNGLNILRRQTVLALLGALLNWPVSLYLGREFGAQGIVEGTLFVTLPATVSNFLQVRSILREKLAELSDPAVAVPEPAAHG